MEEKIKHSFIYKVLAFICYIIFSLLGLSILFNFSPQKLLFTNSYKDKLKLSLFKDFVKIVYENINTPLIKEIRFTLEHEPCPKGFEVLKVEHQYYGTFSKFYGNASFCIKRYDNKEYKYEKFLQNAENECGEGKKRCGKLNNYFNFPLCININDTCPLNLFDFSTPDSNIKFPIPENKSYLLPYYGENKDLPVIINIEIINNEKLCLEKFYREDHVTCEFPDNNQCFIYSTFGNVRNLDLPVNFNLNPKNLINWNLGNYDPKNYFLCKETLEFHIFYNSYFDFKFENLQDFKQEFPIDDETNNPLYLTSQAYKEKNNIDLLFKLISCILICLSLCQLILQILIFSINTKIIRKFYIILSIFLFFCKKLSYFGMIIYHFWFYLKIKKVYIILIDKSLNILVKEYNSTRKIFITKICIFWVLGLLIICFDLIVLVFTFKIKLENNINIKISKKEKKSEEEELNNRNDITGNNPTEINNNINYSKDGHRLETSDNNKNYTNNNYMVQYETENDVDNNNDISSENRIKNSVNIKLQFIFKEDRSKIYKLEVKINEIFKDVIEKLKKQYKIDIGKNKIFNFGSNIINKDKTLEENGIIENLKIDII